MRVLLIVEASKSAAWAVQAVLNQMQPQHAEVSVLNVVPKYSTAEKLSDAREYAARVEAQLRHAGFKADAAVAEGNPGSTVIDHATRWKADLIVVGSGERTGLGRFLTRSTADSIMRQSPCSVQVVRTPEMEPKILLAMDESAVSEDALQELISQNRPRGTEVRVLHLIEAMPLLADGQAWQSEEKLAAARREQYRKAESLSTRAAQALRDAGFRATTAIGQSITKSAVMDSAKQWQAGLVVMGSQSARDNGCFPAEKVSAEIARQANCSVQITRAHAVRSTRYEPVLV